MSTNKTANLNLHSWESTDFVKRTEFNENFNVIDSEIGNVKDEVGTGAKQTVSLVNGANTIASVPRSTPLKVLSTVGKTDVIDMKGIFGVKNPTIEANGKREVVETTLHALNGVQDELFRDTDGKLKKRVRFKEMLLDGSLGWEYDFDFAGYKGVRISFSSPDYTKGNIAKYDGKIIELRSSGTGGVDQSVIAGSKLYLTIADTDSGWGETYTPTADEIKAYFYGWRMNNYGTLNPYTTGTKEWHKIYNGSGTNNGGVVAGSGVTTLPTTMNDMLGTPYKLVYQLATERIEEVATSGQVVLEEGNNTVELKQGVIVKERANPVLGDPLYFININGGVYPAVKGSELKNKAKSILAIYKNDKIDTSWRLGGDANSYGSAHADIPKADFDPTATYYVTYEILPELTAKAEPMQIEYASSLKSLVESNTRQLAEHEGRLDSLSRKNDLTWIPLILQSGWVHFGASTYTTSVPAYRLEDDKKIIRLKGIIKSGTIADGTLVAQLPSGVRPIEEQWVPVQTNDGTSRYPAMIAVRPDGTLRVYGAKSAWVTLDNVSVVLM